jgi:hypothetical protein
MSHLRFSSGECGVPQTRTTTYHTTSPAFTKTTTESTVTVNCQKPQKIADLLHNRPLPLRQLSLPAKLYQ